MQLDPKTLDQTLEQALRGNPDLQAMQHTIRQQAAAGLKFTALEKGGSGANINVIKSALGGEVSLDAAAAAVFKQFEAMPSVERPIGHRRVQLKAGEAERFDYVLPMNVPGKGPERFAITSYVLIRRQDAYVITITANTGLVARYTPTFERVAHSFHFLGK